MNDVIFIKKINGRWRVWRGDADDPCPEPARTDRHESCYSDAIQYASDWANKSYNVGVRVLGEAA